MDRSGPDLWPMLDRLYRRRSDYREFCDELKMDVSRFDAAPLIAFTAIKETEYGKRPSKPRT